MSLRPWFVASFALAAAVAALADPALAQDPSRERDSIPLVHAPPIVVTANRGATPAPRIASSVTAIPGDEIERRQIRTVLDALRDVPGVAVVQNGGPGGVASVFLRGAGSDHALVLVDGVAVNDPASPNGAYDFAQLLTSDVERIEVLRGPQSTLYGSSAMGGVVQIFTRRGAGPARVRATVEAGTFASRQMSAGVSGGDERLSFALTAAERRTDGISAAPSSAGNRERDEHRARSLSGRVEWRPRAALDVGATLRVSDAETEIDQGTPTGDDPNFVSRPDELSGRAWGGLELREGRWRQSLAVGFARHDRVTEDAPDAARPRDRSRSSFEGRRWEIEWIHDAELAGRALVGLESGVETASGSFRSESDFGPFASELPEESVRTTGLFVHHESARGPFSAAIGARLDDHSRFGRAATFRVAPLLRFGAVRLKATYGTGFKAPTAFQLFDPEFGDPDLDPERSRGWDAGVEADLAGARVRLGATVFATDFEDLVGFEFPGGYRNVNEASSEGLEASASAIVRERVRFRASYTYTDAEDDAGEQLLRRPRHQGSASVELVMPRRGDLAVELRLVGEREDQDFTAFPAARVRLDGYALVRVAGAWAVGETVRVFGRVENALDQGYEEAFGFGTPGRALYAGVDASF